MRDFTKKKNLTMYILSEKEQNDCDRWLSSSILQIMIWMLLLIPSQANSQSGGTYEAVRMNDHQPIITNQMFSLVGATEEGANINGPSLIRVPDWIPPEERADPNAQYYLYFAHHDGPYIRMAWAQELEGPWYLYNVGSDVPVGQRGVLDQGGQPISLDNGIMIEFNHVASPDAHVDHENQQIILYFHCGSSTFVNGEEVKKQVSYVATSYNGLEFYNQIESVFLGPSYFRVFEYQQELFALTNDGTPYRAANFTTPWTPPQDHNFKNYLWNKHPENPFQLDINNDGYTRSQLRVRHTAVRLVNDELHVFYSRRGELQERIQLSTIDLSVGDWEKWDATYPPKDILRPEPGWEGGDLPLEASEKGSAPENVNQLRDPFVFEDEDGSIFLLYTGRGEDAIGLAVLYYLEHSLEGNDITDEKGTQVISSNQEEPWISEDEGAGSPPGEEIENLVDNDNFTKYTVRDAISWIDILPKRYSMINGYTITFANDHPARDPKIWELLGWDDVEEKWVSLHAFINYPVREQKYLKKSWSLKSEEFFSKYRVNIHSINGDPDGLMQLAELQVFGELGDSIPIQINDTLAVDPGNALAYRLYPNPSDGLLNIFNPSGTTFSYKIISMNGTILLEKQHVRTEMEQIDLRTLPAGMYIFSISNKSSSDIERIIIQ